MESAKSKIEALESYLGTKSYCITFEYDSYLKCVSDFAPKNSFDITKDGRVSKTVYVDGDVHVVIKKCDKNDVSLFAGLTHAAEAVYDLENMSYIKRRRL